MELEPTGAPSPARTVRGAGIRLGKGVGRFLYTALAAGIGTIVILLLVATVVGSQVGEFLGAFSGYDPEHESAIDCNVIALDVHGVITTYRDSTNADGLLGTETPSGELVAHLMQAKENGSIKAVLLDIDSPGGYPQGAKEAAEAVRALNKPSVAWVRGAGDSAAYWIASAATTIVASPVSDVGSIGVTASYTDVSKQNADEGITYNSISTGKFKDTGDPDKPLTSDERSYIERQNYQLLSIFIQDVALWREMSEEAVRAIADGSSFLGAEAKEKGLVDVLGTRPEAFAALKEQIGEEPRLCWPQYQ